MKSILLTIIVTLGLMPIAAQSTEQPNIVFIFIDDLNDYTQVFDGQPQSATPAIAQLASEGTVFLNAFANSTKCMPSRHSIISGKDVAYTQVFKNESCDPFRDFFTEGDDNPWVYTFAEVLKDSAGYFTYGINKYEQCFDVTPDYDTITADQCSKGLSWNKFFYIPGGESYDVTMFSSSLQEGSAGFSWYRVPDSLETKMLDYTLIDSALEFIDSYDSDPAVACDRPLFLMLGLRKPHLPWYIPEHYFMDDYISDFYEEPYSYPYNFPEQSFPYNGVVMPEQPIIKYGDYYALPDTGLGRKTADAGDSHILFDLVWNELDELPEIDPSLTVEERRTVIGDSYRANAIIAYLAAVKFIDAQVGRFIDSLQTNYPEFYSNTVFITTSDHGYSFGEKRTWKKGTLWESDIRVPFIINDMRAPNAQVVKDAVGLIDIFPTLMDFAESPYPMINDTVPYLDGKSLMPYMANPNLRTERGIVSAVRVTNDDCFCFPQYSVRTDRFHYIYYTSNNANFATPGCHKYESFHEEELYDLGTDRENDYNEWNNLINDADYAPLLMFMQSFLPDSANYQKTLYKTAINLNSAHCLPDRNSGFRLSTALYNDEGLPLSPMEFSNYTFRWTNNLTNDTMTGFKLTFPLALVDSAVFADNDKMLFFLSVTDNASGQQVAFDMKTVYINSAHTPSLSFNLLGSDSIIEIVDYSLTGTYDNLQWKTSTGYNGSGLPPTPLSVDGPGTYQVKGTVFYGNRANCKISTTRVISILSPPLKQSEKEGFFKVIPNPADQQLTIEWNTTIQPISIQVHNMNGELVFLTTEFFENMVSIPSAELPAGLYTVSLMHPDDVQTEQIIIMHGR